MELSQICRKRFFGVGSTFEEIIEMAENGSLPKSSGPQPVEWGSLQPTIFYCDKDRIIGLAYRRE